MARFLSRSIIGLCALLGCATPVAAHHSFAMFDEGRGEEISGTVAKFSWTNPHVVFWIISLDKQNKATVWAIESPFGPSVLKRYGWTKDSLKIGDKVSLWISPLRNGKPGGSLQKLTFISSGKVLYNGSRGPYGGSNLPGGGTVPADAGAKSKP